MSEPIRLGLVGVGRAGWGMHCPEISNKTDMFKFVAACDIIPERRDKMKESYGCKTYDDIHKLVLDPDVEIVDIATRSCDHYAHARLALEAGKDVLLEKPFSETYAEACELYELADKLGRKIYARHNRRFEEHFKRYARYKNRSCSATFMKSISPATATAGATTGRHCRATAVVSC